MQIYIVVYIILSLLIPTKVFSRIWSTTLMVWSSDRVNNSFNKLMNGEDLESIKYGDKRLSSILLPLTFEVSTSIFSKNGYLEKFKDSKTIEREGFDPFNEIELMNSQGVVLFLFSKLNH